MGYFSNGTEGEMYAEEYCSRCVHWKDNGSGCHGCPVWDLHFLHNYDQLPSDKDSPEQTKGRRLLASVLGTLIPRNKDDLGNQQCAMFHPADENRCTETAEMFPRMS